VCSEYVTITERFHAVYAPQQEIMAALKGPEWPTGDWLLRKVRPAQERVKRWFDGKSRVGLELGSRLGGCEAQCKRLGAQACMSCVLWHGSPCQLVGDLQFMLTS
jgi:hypothetical protein